MGQMWLQKAYAIPHHPQDHTRELRGVTPIYLGGTLLWELLDSCRFRVGQQGQPFRCLSLTWDGDLNDIQILWFNFDGPQPTQLPGGSWEETRDPVKCGQELGLARQVIPKHSLVCDWL